MTAHVIRRTVCLLVLLAAGATIASASEKTEVEYFGVDFGHFETYAWRPGVPAPNFEVERTIHQAVDRQLVAKGLSQVEDEADCFVLTRTAKDRHFPVGVLFVELRDAESERLVWRGMATGVVAEDRLKTRKKLAAKVVNRMFEQFPDLGD